MRPWIRSLPLAALSPLIACAPREGDPTGFSSAPGIVTVSSETPSGTTSGGTTSPGGTVASSTTTGDDGSASGSTAPAMFPDLGGIPDLGNPQPLGCKGKIDFLFVISRSGWMASDSEGIGTIYERLVAAIPQFFDTIQTNFADFDYHILVTKGDVHWGDPYCNEECPGPFTEKCWPGDEYPCEMVDEASTCDHTWGAGVVFNAGRNAPNTPCDVAGGRRYLTKDQPNLDETFACVLQVGTSGHDMLGQALTAAVSPELNGPGGCNEGFLRDDALLVVTLVTSHEDPVSEGTPYSWVKAVSAAKGDDRDAIVMLYIGPPDSLEWCLMPPQYAHLCEMFNEFPQRVAASRFSESFGPAFETATDLIVDACESFIPK